MGRSPMRLIIGEARFSIMWTLFFSIVTNHWSRKRSLKKREILLPAMLTSAVICFAQNYSMAVEHKPDVHEIHIRGQRSEEGTLSPAAHSSQEISPLSQVRLPALRQQIAEDNGVLVLGVLAAQFAVDKLE